MSWASTGWANVEPPQENTGGSGPQGNSNRFEQMAPRKWFVPKGGMKRCMFLSSMPITFYEHGMYAVNRDIKDKPICLAKNKIEEHCPLCEVKGPDGKSLSWPSFIGYFPVIDMGDVSYQNGEVILTGWTSPKGVTYQFDQKALGAKRGGSEKPGMLLEIQHLMNKYGDLAGCVFDVRRTGGMSERCGDRFDFVEKVAPDDWEEYLIDAGADPARIKEALEPENYHEAFKIHSAEQLRNMIPKGLGQPSQAGASGASY